MKDNNESPLHKIVWNGDGMAVVTRKKDIKEYIRFKIPVGQYNFVYFEIMCMVDGLYQTGWMDEEVVEQFCQLNQLTRDDFKTVTAAEMHELIKQKDEKKV